MGKGDIKTRRGKLFKGSYGVLRPRKRKLRGVPGPETAHLKETPEKVSRPKTRSVNKDKDEIKTEEVTKAKEKEVNKPEAEVKAERILNNAHNRLAQIHEDIAELKRQRTQFELKIRATIETYQKMLDMQKEEEAEVEDLESKLKFFTKP